MHCMLLVSKLNTLLLSIPKLGQSVKTAHIRKGSWGCRVHTYCFLSWCFIWKETHHPTTYLILVSIACFCIMLTSGEFLPPTLCVETFKLCSSRKQTLSGSTASILLQLRTPLCLNPSSDFSNSSCLGSQVLLCGFQQERTFAHLQMPGFVHCPSAQFPARHTLNSGVPGCPDSYMMGTFETHKTDCMLRFPSLWKSSISFPELVLLQV